MALTEQQKLIEASSKTLEARAKALKVAQEEAYEHLFGGGGGGDPTPFLPAWEADRETITELVVPEGVTKIGSCAFAGFAVIIIDEVVLSSTVEEISGPFACEDLNEYGYIMGQEIGRRNRVKKITFAENSNLKKLGWSSLSGIYMDEIYIPDGVTTIMNHALALNRTSGTKYISLPSSLEKLEPGAFVNNYTRNTIPPTILDDYDTVYDITFRGKTKDEVLSLCNYYNAYEWDFCLTPNSVLHCTDGDITVDENCLPVL